VRDERIISQKHVLRRRRSFQIGIHNRDNRNRSRFNRQLNLDNPIDTYFILSERVVRSSEIASPEFINREHTASKRNESHENASIRISSYHGMKFIKDLEISYE
jgi:hypothetical protein